MVKVLVAGSTGFVGTHLARRIEKQTSMILRTVNRSSGDYVFSRMDEMTEDFDLVFVIFAALPGKDIALNDYRAINVELTENLIKKFPKARFVFTSSISIYENSIEKPCSEVASGREISDYARTKLEAERLFENHDSIVLRLSSLYGPEMKETSFLPITVKSALEKKQIKLIGETGRKQNYTYIDDVVDFLLIASESKHRGIFNAVNEKSHTNEELAQVVQASLPGVEIVTEENQQIPYSFEISNKKWMDHFNQGPKVCLEDGLGKYIAYKRT